MAIERIRWVPHAVRGVETRSAITREMVEAAILHPDEEVRDDAHVGRRIAHKLITDGGRTYLLRAFYETGGGYRHRDKLLPHLSNRPVLEGRSVNVKVTFDPKYDVAYIRVREGRSVKQEEVAPGVIMDVSEDGLPLGFEFLNARATFGGEPTGVSFEMDSREPAATKG